MRSRQRCIALFKVFPAVLSAVTIAGVLVVAAGCKKGSDQGGGGTPGTAATSPSAAANAKPTTPKAVTLAFSRALSAGDVATAKAISTGDIGPQTLETLSKVASATGRLQNALKSKFGQKAMQLEIFTESPDPQDELNRSTETITGDTAVIALSATDHNPTTLKRVDGQWKVDVTKFKQAEPMLPQLEKMAAAWNELAQDVTADKFATLDDFQKAFTAKAQAAAGG